MSLLERRKRRCTNQNGKDSWDALFIENHSSISGGLKMTLYDWMRLRPKPLLHWYGGRTSTTRKHLGSRARAWQLKTERTHELKRRLSGCQENLWITISRIWPSSPQTSSSRASSNATKPTICLTRRGFGTRWLEDRLEVVWHSVSSKLSLLRMASVCVVAVVLMVKDIIWVAWVEIFFWQMKVFRFQTMSIPL